MTPSKIISGGQTGADRAGLDFAIERGIPHGGWCPKGRKAEDGVVPAIYEMIETPSGGYMQRTVANIRESDGTVLFTGPNRIGPGSALTIKHAARLGRSLIYFTSALDLDWCAHTLKHWVNRYSIGTLNVAGSRESKEHGIHDFVVAILRMAFPKRICKDCDCEIDDIGCGCNPPDA